MQIGNYDRFQRVKKTHQSNETRLLRATTIRDDKKNTHIA